MDVNSDSIILVLKFIKKNQDIITAIVILEVINLLALVVLFVMFKNSLISYSVVIGILVSSIIAMIFYVFTSKQTENNKKILKEIKDNIIAQVSDALHLKQQKLGLQFNAYVSLQSRSKFMKMGLESLKSNNYVPENVKKSQTVFPPDIFKSTEKVYFDLKKNSVQDHFDFIQNDLNNYFEHIEQFDKMLFDSLKNDMKLYFHQIEYENVNENLIGGIIAHFEMIEFRMSAQLDLLNRQHKNLLNP